MMKKYSLKYGKSSLDFELPADQVICEIEGRNAEGIKNLEGSYRQALDHPIDAPPLKEIIAPGHRVAIIVSDITRARQRSDKTLPMLLGYLNEAGLSDDQVSIVIGWAPTAATRNRNSSSCARRMFAIGYGSSIMMPGTAR